MNMKIFGLLCGIGVVGIAAMPILSVAEDAEEIVEVEDEEYFDEDWEDEGIEKETPAEETPAVVETARLVSSRLTCTEINEKVSELREDVKMYPEKATELETMLARQRTQCAPRAARRPVRNYDNINPVRVIDAVPVEEVVEEEQVVEPVKVAEVVKPEPEKTPEEIAAEKAAAEALVAENLAKGLCGDGAKPNKFGCCAGYKFKEVSQMKFQCCPTEGDGDCVEPIKKK
ncbi:MAG: hypothetical protein J6T57_00025 [Alphaproteobacteria bacterium]|nr:hypothetical protein [Alphaproteobacteria bacterium]